MKRIIFALVMTMLFSVSTLCIQEEPVEEDNTWVDLSDFRSVLHSRPGTEFVKITKMEQIGDTEPGKSLLVVVGVNREMGDEAGCIYEFIQEGGSAVIAGDDGKLNPVTRPFGIETYGHQIYSENYDKNVSFVGGEGYLDGSNYTLLFNAPTGFHVTHEEVEKRTIAALTVDKWQYIAVDYNDNGIIEGDEWPEEVPVASGIEINSSGGGNVAFFSDSGLFVDDMLHRYENRDYVRDLIKDYTRMNITRIYYYTGFHTKNYSEHIRYGD